VLKKRLLQVGSHLHESNGGWIPGFHCSSYLLIGMGDITMGDKIFM